MDFRSLTVQILVRGFVTHVDGFGVPEAIEKRNPSAGKEPDGESAVVLGHLPARDVVERVSWMWGQRGSSRDIATNRDVVECN